MHIVDSIRKGPGRVLPLIAVVALLAGCGQSSAPQAETKAASAALSAGDEIPVPQSEVILTVNGAISESNVESSVSLDMATIADMVMTEATILEPFLKEDVTFTGVMLADLLKVVGADPDAGMVFMKALDDYSVEVPIAEAVESSAMIAIEENGEPIKVRHGGPARLIFVSESSLASNTDMWIWSVDRMNVKR